MIGRYPLCFVASQVIMVSGPSFPHIVYDSAKNQLKRYNMFVKPRQVAKRK